MIKELGGSVASVWDGLRPMTKKMLVGVLQSSNPTPVNTKSTKFSYDAHADWEVSRLLTALDEQSRKSSIRKNAVKLAEISQFADACARVLEAQSASAEVFIQLAERVIRENNYDRLDKLADRLTERYSAGEIAEIVRQTELPQIRAIAYETLSMLPIPSILPLLDDSLYAEIAAGALEQKAYEFDSDEARDILDQLEAESALADQ